MRTATLQPIDRNEVARWVDQHGDALFAYARARVRDSATAEDLVQETFLAAVEQLDRFDRRSSPRTWLTGILRHKLIDYLRTKTREESRVLKELDAVVALLFDTRGKWRRWPDEWSPPEGEAEAAELRRVLNQCLDRLPGRAAEIFLLREREQLQTDDITHITGASAANIWTLLYRARIALRQCLDRHWFGRDRP